MADQRKLMLCNTSDAQVTWEVEPAGGEPMVVVQMSCQYGWISVPFAGSYKIACGEVQVTATSPGVAASFNGSEITICTPA